MENEPSKKDVPSELNENKNNTNRPSKEINKLHSSSTEKKEIYDVSTKSARNTIVDEEFEREFGILTPSETSKQKAQQNTRTLKHLTTIKKENILQKKEDIKLPEDITKCNISFTIENKIPYSNIYQQLGNKSIGVESEDEQITDYTSTRGNKSSIDNNNLDSIHFTNGQKLSILSKLKNLFLHEEKEIEQYNIDIHGPLVSFDYTDGIDEVERYWLIEPYSFVTIQYNPSTNKYFYCVVEPKLSEFEQVFLTEIKKRLRDILLFEVLDTLVDKESMVDSKIRDIIKDYSIEITPKMLEKISYYIKRDFVRYGKIDPLMYDNSVEDISANGKNVPIFLYHRKYHNIKTNIVFNENELDPYIIQLAQKSGKHISLAQPIIDATIPDGSRIQMTLGSSITTRGGTFTIRKFSEIPVTPIDLINWGTFSTSAMAYLWLCIENNKSLIYAGGTASGKTSSLNAISLFIPEISKVVTLEDTRELKLSHMNWIPAVTRDSFTADEKGAVDMYELLKAALRQRPEYIIVGEVRGKEALTLFQAMATGHTTFSTMHADSVASAIYRLENPPISVPRNMIQALDIMSIQAQTYSKGERVRRNLKIVEIIDIDPNTRNIRTNDIFVWDSSTDTFVQTGESKAIHNIIRSRGWTAQRAKKELDVREKILHYMVSNNITDFRDIAAIISAYQSSPNKILEKLEII